MRKMKMSSKQNSDLINKLTKLIQKILKTHPRSTQTYLGKYTLTEQSGRLFGKRSNNNIKIKTQSKGLNLSLDIEMMDYYKFLDEGTENIMPWYFTEEIMDNPELAEIIDELMNGMVLETILDIKSDIEKK